MANSNGTIYEYNIIINDMSLFFFLSPPEVFTKLIDQ